MLCGLGELIELQLDTQDVDGAASSRPSHEEMATFLLGIWAMPFPVLTAIRWYKQPSMAGEEGLYGLALVHAAWAMYTMVNGSGEIDLQSDFIDTDYLDATVGSDVLEKWRAIAQKLLLGGGDDD